ncbi:CopG family ribbon-helix-helix protein [Caballeronia cordobensis]|nr:ribbon-helix-helix protein, CopG family [Caballeronia cordobensis]
MPIDFADAVGREFNLPLQRLSEKFVLANRQKHHRQGYCDIIDVTETQEAEGAMAEALKTVTAQLPVNLVDRMDDMAARLDRSKQWIVRKAVVAYMARAERERQMIQEGLDDVDSGRLVSMEAIERWADSLGTDDELPLPKVGD